MNETHVGGDDGDSLRSLHGVEVDDVRQREVAAHVRVHDEKPVGIPLFDLVAEVVNPPGRAQRRELHKVPAKFGVGLTTKVIKLAIFSRFKTDLMLKLVSFLHSSTKHFSSSTG